MGSVEHRSVLLEGTDGMLEVLVAGEGPAVVVQPLEDVIAPPGNATQIVEAIGDRASMATVAGAGHALLPEQPDEVARILLDWLTSRWA